MEVVIKDIIITTGAKIKNIGKIEETGLTITTSRGITNKIITEGEVITITIEVTTTTIEEAMTTTEEATTITGAGAVTKTTTLMDKTKTKAK